MRVAVAGTGGACAAAVAVWLLAVPLGGVELVDASGHDIGIVAVVLVSLLAGAAGFGLLALLTRRRDRSRTWTVIAGAVLAVSLLGPVSAATTAALLTMLCLHVLVGGIVISTGLLGVRRTG